MNGQITQIWDSTGYEEKARPHLKTGSGDGWVGDPKSPAGLATSALIVEREKLSVYTLRERSSAQSGRFVGDTTILRQPTRFSRTLLSSTAPTAVIVTDTEFAWRMADVIWIDGGARNPKVPTLFQVADVDNGVINWVNADLATHICPRV